MSLFLKIDKKRRSHYSWMFSKNNGREVLQRFTDDKDESVEDVKSSPGADEREVHVNVQAGEVRARLWIIVTWPEWHEVTSGRWRWRVFHRV